MRGTLFYKMTGSGNDFVVLDGRATPPDAWPPARVRAICDRRNGVGADGLVILTPAAAGGGPDVLLELGRLPRRHVRQCGALQRAASVDLELVPAGEFCLLTDAGLVRVISPAQADEAEINLPDCDLPRDLRRVSTAQPGEHWFSLGTVGVPHLVVRVDDIEAVDVAGRGRVLRSDPRLGPAGANVNFVSPPERPGAPG